MSWRPMVRTWRKPSVVTSAVRAPLPSRIMLVATVVPCSTRPSVGALSPASSSASRMPVRKAWLGSLGMLGVLARQIWPLSASCRAMSVKVPPMSTAIASAGSGKAVYVRVAMERFGFGPPGAQSGRRLAIDRAVRQGDPVEMPRRFGADKAAQDVFQHHLRRPIERMAVTAAAAGLDPEHVAFLQEVAVRQRLQDALVVGAVIDQDAARTAGHTARHAPGRVFDAVDAHRQHAFL